MCAAGSLGWWRRPRPGGGEGETGDAPAASAGRSGMPMSAIAATLGHGAEHLGLDEGVGSEVHHRAAHDRADGGQRRPRLALPRALGQQSAAHLGLQRFAVDVALEGGPVGVADADEESADIARGGID